MDSTPIWSSDADLLLFDRNITGVMGISWDRHLNVCQHITTEEFNCTESKIKWLKLIDVH